MTALQSWTNQKQPTDQWPDWVRAHVIGQPEANGSFMIRTKAGKRKAQARVHVGALVIERKGVAYTCPASEAQAFVSGLDGADSATTDQRAQAIAVFAAKGWGA